MKVPIRLTRMTVSNGSSAWAPRLPTTRPAQPIPAHETAIRSGTGCSAAALTAACTASASRDVGAHEARALAKLARERVSLLLVQVGDHHVRAAGVQPSSRGFAKARGAARDERAATFDLHDAGTL